MKFLPKPRHGTFTRLFAGFWFFSAPAAYRPDIRHWSDDLAQSAPQFADFEDFLAELDLDKDAATLEKESEERQAQITQLEGIDRKSLSDGQAFRLDKQQMELLLQQATYLRFKFARDSYFKDGQWRRPAAQANPYADKELAALSLQTLALARSMVNTSAFENEQNLALLIRLMARTGNSNILLFFEQFKKKFPTSPSLPLVQHVMAEYYLQQPDQTKAEPALKAAMEFKDSPIRPYTVYRLAWMHLSRYYSEKDKTKQDEALKKASAALRLSLKLMDEHKGPEVVFDLKREALRDLAWIFALTRLPKDEARKALADLGGKEAYRDYLYYLGIETGRSGFFQTAQTSFNDLLLQDPHHRDVPRILFNISELHLQSKLYPVLVASYDRIKGLLAVPSAWQETWAKDPELLGLTQKQLGQHIAHAAQLTYELAEKAPEPQANTETPKPVAEAVGKTSQPAAVAKAGAEPPAPAPSRIQLFAASKDLYKLYASWYPQGDAVEDARYNNALSLFYTGELEQSLQLLSAIAADEKSRFRRDASYNAVMIAVNFDQKQEQPKLPPPGKSKAPVPLTRAKALLVERIDSFLQIYPDADDRVSLQYMAAQTYFDFGHYAEALKRFDRLVLDAPETEQGESALHTMLGYQVEAGLWADVISHCETYIRNKKVTGAGHRKILRQTLQYAKGQI